MTECPCNTPPPPYQDFDSEPFGVDLTNGRYGEVTIETCQACGARWLKYFVEYEAFSRSGRWYRGLVSEEQLAGLTPSQAPALIASLPWYLYGGSYFDTVGRKGSGPVYVDLHGAGVGGDRVEETVPESPRRSAGASSATSAGERASKRALAQALRRTFVKELQAGLRLVWPILSGLFMLIAVEGVLVGLVEGWTVGESIYFAFITSLTIGYGDFVPTTLLTRVLAVAIGVCGVLATALVAAIAVQALSAAQKEPAPPGGEDEV